MTTPLSNLLPQHPVLYRLASDGEALDLLYAQCPACGKLAFPANVPGCGHCGASLLDAVQVARPGRGTLMEYVTLHVPLLPGMEVPSIAADILLDAGPIEEGVLESTDEADLRVGMALRAVAVPVPGGELFACRFVPTEGEPA
ncbi:MAG: hypothetical protein EOO27_43040 [Comamonadaceae bacterium]|nr:MAG: hypothetical protein EOO27_43040 [Comamonadaceae bacterium]